jgi:hypothetical protein
MIIICVAEERVVVAEVVETIEFRTPAALWCVVALNANDKNVFFFSILFPSA